MTWQERQRLAETSPEQQLQGGGRQALHQEAQGEGEPLKKTIGQGLELATGRILQAASPLWTGRISSGLLGDVRWGARQEPRAGRSRGSDQDKVYLPSQKGPDCKKGHFLEGITCILRRGGCVRLSGAGVLEDQSRRENSGFLSPEKSQDHSGRHVSGNLLMSGLPEHQQWWLR